MLGTAVPESSKRRGVIGPYPPKATSSANFSPAGRCTIFTMWVL